MKVSNTMKNEEWKRKQMVWQVLKYGTDSNLVKRSEKLHPAEGTRQCQVWGLRLCLCWGSQSEHSRVSLRSHKGYKVKEVRENCLNKDLDAIEKDEAFVQSKITRSWDVFRTETKLSESYLRGVVTQWVYSEYRALYWGTGGSQELFKRIFQQLTGLIMVPYTRKTVRKVIYLLIAAVFKRRS